MVGSLLGLGVKGVVLILVVLLVIISIVLVIPFLIVSEGSKTTDYGVLDYLPYDKIMEFRAKGYRVFLVVSVGGLSNESLGEFKYLNEFMDEIELFVYGYIGRNSHDSSTTYPNLFIIYGEKGLFDRIKSSNRYFNEVVAGKPETVEDYMVWSGRTYGIDYIIMTNSDKSIVTTIVLADIFSNTTVLSRDDALDIAITIIESLKKRPGWKDIDAEVSELVKKIPMEYRERIGMVYLSDDMVIMIAYPNKLIKEPLDLGVGVKIYAIMPKHVLDNWVKELKSKYNMSHMEVSERDYYLLVELKIIGPIIWPKGIIQDALIHVTHFPNNTIDAKLFINIRNVYEKTIKIKEIRVDGRTIWSGETIIKPGVTYSNVYKVYSGPYDPSMEVGTEHTLTIVYDIVGGESNQSTTIKIRAT